MKRRQQNRVTNRKSNLLNRIDILRNKEKPAIDKIRLNGGFLSNSSTVYEDKKEKTNRQNNDLSLRVLEAGLEPAQPLLAILEAGLEPAQPLLAKGF